LQLEVLTVVLLKTPVFWDVTLCHWVSSPQNFEGSLCLHRQVVTLAPTNMVFNPRRLVLSTEENFKHMVFIPSWSFYSVARSTFSDCALQWFL